MMKNIQVNMHVGSVNYHLSGYSEVYKEKIYVKIFSIYDNYLSEIYINTLLYKNRILDYGNEKNNYFCVLRYETYEDIDSKKFCEYDAYSLGKVIAKHHLLSLEYVGQNKLKHENIFFQTYNFYNRIGVKRGLKKINDYFKDIIPKLVMEYKELPKVFIHGDFGFRNIKIVHQEMVLIDFERSKLGIQYEDFSKCFYREIEKKSFQKKFKEGYQKICKLVIPSKELRCYIDYYNALGIFIYIEYFEDDEFEEMGYQIIDSICKKLNLK